MNKKLDDFLQLSEDAGSLQITGFYREKEFKETEIGKVPRDWDVVKLGNADLSRIIMGQSPPSNTYNDEGIGLPFLQGKMEFGEIYPSPKMYCSQPMKTAEPNDILISVRAPVGDVNIASFKLCIGRGLAAIRFNLDKADFRFYFYYFQKIKRYLENLGKGSTFKAVTKEDLENLKIPLPPLPEQQKIAEVLSTIDSAIQKINEGIERAERIKKGLMKELLSGKVRVKEENGSLTFWREKEFKETEIGKVPRDWDVVRLGDKKITIFLKSGSTPSKKVSEYWGGNIPFVTQADMTKVLRYLYDTSSKITQLALEDCGLNLVPENSVLLSMYGTIGKVVINKVSVAVSQNIAAIVPNKEIVSEEYLFYTLQKNSYQLQQKAKTITLKHLDIKIVKQILIPLPPLQEQQKIAEILSQWDKIIEMKKAKKEKLERMKKKAMELLLTGKVRVRLQHKTA